MPAPANKNADIEKQPNANKDVRKDLPDKEVVREHETAFTLPVFILLSL